jgi:hypothetical protein
MSCAFAFANFGFDLCSTAGGALWQQRPYPAPGKALLGKKKVENSLGPIFMAPSKK